MNYIDWLTGNLASFKQGISDKEPSNWRPPVQSIMQLEQYKRLRRVAVDLICILQLYIDLK